jgi:hypothetical protein
MKPKEKEISHVTEKNMEDNVKRQRDTHRQLADKATEEEQAGLRGGTHKVDFRNGRVVRI